MRKTLYALALVILGAAIPSAMKPLSAYAQAKPVAPVAGPVTVLPQIDATSAQAFAPLADQRDKLQKQIIPLLQQLNEVNKNWRMAEAQALVKAKLDPAQYGVAKDGKSFQARQGVPGR